MPAQPLPADPARQPGVAAARVLPEPPPPPGPRDAQPPVMSALPSVPAVPAVPAGPAAEPPLLAWHADVVTARLAPTWPGVQVEVVAQAASTNSVLLARGRAADGGRSPALPCVLVAEQQTGGRGRLGRAWQSQRGASLTFSLALPFAPADWSGLSLAVGVALAEALDDGAAADGPRIRLKWPNDLWLMPAAPVAAAVNAGSSLADLERPAADAQRAAVGRKLGGILIETVALPDGRRLAVIGIGLNVLPFATQALPGSDMASLSEIDAQASAPGTLARLLPPLAGALGRFERDGFAVFAARFAARDALRGRLVVAGELAGLADGVTASGALRLRTPHGVRQVVGGEVSVRLQSAAEVAP